jgi:hypothetical protein
MENGWHLKEWSSLGNLGKCLIADGTILFLLVFTLMELEHKDGKVGIYDDIMMAYNNFYLRLKNVK